MVAFVDYDRGARDPWYVNLSKEPDNIKADTRKSSLLEGITTVGNNIVKAVDTYNKMSIDKELEDRINVEREESAEAGIGLLAGTNARTAAIPSQTATDATVPIGGTEAADPLPDPLNLNPETVPPAVQRSLAQANKLAQANRMGRIDDVNYYGKMVSIVRDATLRNPGYVEYIREKATSILGTNPANALRTSVQASLNQLAAGSKTDQWGNDVEKWLPILGGMTINGRNGAEYALSPEVRGDPAKQDNIRVIVGKQLAAQHQDKLRDDQVQSALRRGALAEKEAEAAVPAIAFRVNQDIFTRTHLAGGAEKTGEDIFREIQRMAGKPLAPDVAAAFKNGVLNMRTAAELKFNEEVQKFRYTDAQGRPASVQSLVKNNTAINQYREEMLRVYDAAIKSIEQGNTVLAAASTSWVNAVGENVAAKLIMDKAFAKLVGLERLMKGSTAAVLNSAMIQNNWTELRDMGNTLNQFNTVDILTGGITSLDDFNTRYRDIRAAATPGTAAAAWPKDPPASYVKGYVNMARSLITNKDVDPEDKVKVANVIINDGTAKVFDALSPQERIDLWATLNAPDVAFAFKQMQEFDDGVYQRYLNWTEATFKRISNAYIDDVNRAVVNSKGLNIEFKDGRLTYQEIAPRGRLPRMDAQGNRVNTLPINDTAKDAIDRLNILFNIQNNVLKMEGGELDLTYLKKLGIKLDAPPMVDQDTKDFWNDVKRAFEKAMDPEGDKPRIFRKPEPEPTPPASPPDPIPGSHPSQRRGEELRGNPRNPR
jgi:hypothetical protein